MLSNSTVIGATTQGTTFADIIINNVNSVAEGAIQGFAQFVHDPKALRDTVSLFSKSAAPKKFADAVVLRRIETQKLDDIWNFPLNMAVPTTTPIPWTVVEATVRSQVQTQSWEFNIMRTVDFVGRNYIRLILPSVDCTYVQDSFISAHPDLAMSIPSHTYLGAWQRDLVPRIIEKVEFYPRSNSHKLFEYSGYDIFVHNILFGNAHKEMNDLMAGEDKFELCYDPYRVDGSALGLASFKGVDTADTAITLNTITGGTGNQALTSNVVSITDSQNQLMTAELFKNLLLDTTMDTKEFKSVYRHNVWYEAPIAQNYHARHSIHSRRMYHEKKDITIPLDILPFGYSVASSLPSAALSGECGFIKISLYQDWFDRAFYLTKLSDIPSLHPLINHRHYESGDWIQNGAADVVGTGGDTGTTPLLTGWVNMRSIGHFGDPQWRAAPATGTNENAPADDVDDDTLVENQTLYGFNLPDQKFSQPNAILGGIPGLQNRENIIKTPINRRYQGSYINTPAGRNAFGPYQPAVNVAEGVTVYGPPTTSQLPGSAAYLQNRGVATGIDRNPSPYQTTGNIQDDLLFGMDSDTQFIHKMSRIDQNMYLQYNQSIGIKLLQVGYQTLPCIREFLSKLPNIYITTEWDDKDRSINTVNFDINNDLYIQAIVFWFIPKDNEDIESMRVYPCHMLDHELPIIAGMELVNEQAQGTTIYDWSLLNVFNPAQMNMNPLIENMGLLAFSPTLTSNTLPLAYYDSNINGYLKARFLQGENSNLDTCVNIRNGTFKVISIGINGVASVNLNLFRLVF